MFGEKIKSIRIQKGLTQKQLAEKSGISEISIRKYESNDRKPKFETIRSIASALDVYISDIVGDNWSEFSPKEYSDDWDNGLNAIKNFKPAPDIEERKLIENFRLLNDVGQAKAAEYISDLTEQSKYTVKNDLPKVLAANNPLINKPGQLEKTLEDARDLKRPD